MAGKTSGQLEATCEEVGRYDGAISAALKPSQNSQYGRAGARSNGAKSGSNKWQQRRRRQDDTTANKATGCELDGGCESPANETNNGFGEQDRASNNSGNNKAISASNRSSYSKIFRQYLPSSLNLNYTLAGKSSGSIESNMQASERDGNANGNGNKLKEQLRGTIVEEERRAQRTESGQTNRLVAKSIANALSRFKISGNSVKDKQASDSLLDFADQSRGYLRSSSARDVQVTQKHQQPLAEWKSDNNNNNYNYDKANSQSLSGQVEAQLKISDTPNERRAIEGQSWNQQHFEEPLIQVGPKETRLKRRGFLYLKRSCKRGDETESVSASDSCQNRRCSTNEFERREDRKPISSNRKYPSQRDPNNNSISFILSPSSSNARAHDEHTTCLLDEQEEEEDGEDDQGNNMFSSANKLRQRVPFGQIKPVATETKEANHKKMAPSIGNRSKPTRTSKTGGLLLAGSLMIAAILVGLTVLLTSVTLAQQQLPSSSFRSQPPVQVGGGLGPQSSQQIGGSLAQPASVNGGQQGVNRSPPTPQPAAGSLVANLNCNKIRGHVTLTPNLRGGTTVSTQISAGPPGEVYQWSVHQFPVKPGASMCSCSALILGAKLIDLSEMHGNLPSDQEFNVQSSLNLFGSESPVGHSLMLRGMKTGMVACATFLPTSRKSNYRAKFHTPLSGSVTIFQTAFGTSFISHLMYSNGTRRHSMHRFDLLKSEEDIVTTSLLNGGQLASSSVPSGGRAESQMLLEMREHDNELSQCRKFINGEPLFKNISHQLSVSTESFGMRGRTSLVLPQIPFETFSSVYLVVYSEYDPSEPIACAPLKFVKPKTAAAKFQSVSVQGSVVFSQDSPYDVTVSRINLNLPNSDGHSYGIDELPMIIRRKSDTRVCPNIREIIYNPHHVEPSSVPPEGEATSDQYAVGDLSGKYGSLTGKASERIQVNDFNLPLFGPISIVGRAMTIYSAEGVAIACSNVELTTPMTTAFATFDYGIQGQFIFRQPVNDCNGDTYVYIEVSKPLGQSAAGQSAHTSTSSDSANHHDHNSRSLDHNWHIHVNPVDSGLDHLSTTDCAPAGPHYNPFNTSTASIYTRDCTPFNVLRCELGDLSAKMFTIDIPPYRVKGGQEPDIGKFFGTDIDLPLCGPVSIVNRSVVVHVQDFGVQRLACSTVIEFKPRTS